MHDLHLLYRTFHCDHAHKAAKCILGKSNCPHNRAISRWDDIIMILLWIRKLFIYPLIVPLLRLWLIVQRRNRSVHKRDRCSRRGLSIYPATTLFPYYRWISYYGTPDKFSNSSLCVRQIWPHNCIHTFEIAASIAVVLLLGIVSYKVIYKVHNI